MSKCANGREHRTGKSSLFSAAKAIAAKAFPSRAGTPHLGKDLKKGEEKTSGKAAGLLGGWAERTKA